MQSRSIRLNQSLRDDFVEAVLNEIMPTEKQPTMIKFQTRYAQEVYDAVYGPYKDVISQLPPWAQKSSTCFHAILGDSEALAFIMTTPVITFYENKATQYGHYGMHADHDAPIPRLKSSHRISLALKAQIQAITDWKVKKQHLTTQMNELASNCNTSGQLFKTWPKAMEFAHVFPEAEAKERKVWEPAMDADELDLGVELSQVDVMPIEEN